MSVHVLCHRTEGFWPEPAPAATNFGRRAEAAALAEEAQMAAFNN
jgi:hypothetical protein